VAPVERTGPAEDAPAQHVEPSSSPAIASESTPKAEAEPGVLARLLATPEELPKSSHRVVQTLFVLLQLMYVAFYVGALANLAEIEDLFSPLPRATETLNLLMVTAAILIPVRAFVLTAALFHVPGARGKLLKLWPFLLAADELWALAPFLLLHHINVGLAMACTTLLVYSPFAQRSLVLMGAAEMDRADSETDG
jgi:hypothetical protein